MRFNPRELAQIQAETKESFVAPVEQKDPTLSLLQQSFGVLSSLTKESHTYHSDTKSVLHGILDELKNLRHIGQVPQGKEPSPHLKQAVMPEDKSHIESEGEKTQRQILHGITTISSGVTSLLEVLNPIREGISQIMLSSGKFLSAALSAEEAAKKRFAISEERDSKHQRKMYDITEELGEDIDELNDRNRRAALEKPDDKKKDWKEKASSIYDTVMDALGLRNAGSLLKSIGSGLLLLGQVGYGVLSSGLGLLGSGLKTLGKIGYKAISSGFNLLSELPFKKISAGFLKWGAVAAIAYTTYDKLKELYNLAKDINKAEEDANKTKAEGDRLKAENARKAHELKKAIDAGTATPAQIREYEQRKKTQQKLADETNEEKVGASAPMKDFAKAYGQFNVLDPRTYFPAIWNAAKASPELLGGEAGKPYSGNVAGTVTGVGGTAGTLATAHFGGKLYEGIKDRIFGKAPTPGNISPERLKDLGLVDDVAQTPGMWGRFKNWFSRSKVPTTTPPVPTPPVPTPPVAGAVDDLATAAAKSEGAFARFGTKIKGMTESLFKFTSEKASNVVSGLKDSTKSLVKEIGDKTGGLFKSIHESSKSLWGTVSEKGSSWLGKGINALKGLGRRGFVGLPSGEKILSSLSKATGSIKGALGKAGPLLSGSKEVLKGLASRVGGLITAAFAVNEASTQLGEGNYKEAAKTLARHGLTYVGGLIGAGLAGGATFGAGTVAGAVAGSAAGSFLGDLAFGETKTSNLQQLKEQTEGLVGTDEKGKRVAAQVEKRYAEELARKEQKEFVEQRKQEREKRYQELVAEGKSREEIRKQLAIEFQNITSKEVFERETKPKTVSGSVAAAIPEEGKDKTTTAIVDLKTQSAEIAKETAKTEDNRDKKMEEWFTKFYDFFQKDFAKNIAGALGLSFLFGGNQTTPQSHQVNYTPVSGSNAALPMPEIKTYTPPEDKFEYPFQATTLSTTAPTTATEGQGINNPLLNIPSTPPTLGESFLAKNLDSILKKKGHPDSVFMGKGDLIEKVALQNGIDPAFFASILMQESAWGTSTVLKKYNNPSGTMAGKTKENTEFRMFSSLEEGLNFTAKNLKNRYIGKGMTSISEVGATYAPIGAANDPRGLNKHWVPNVTRLTKEFGGTGAIASGTPPNLFHGGADYAGVQASSAPAPATTYPGGQSSAPGMSANVPSKDDGIEADKTQTNKDKVEVVSPLPPGMNMITSPFGPRTNVPLGGSKEHKGIDLGAPMGTPVLASMSGTVYTINPTWGEIRIKHADGLYSGYMHLSKINVGIGSKVEKGDVIGAVGDTRDRRKIPNMAPHLHFSLFKGGSSINPLPFLQSNAGFSPTYSNADVEKRAKAGINSNLSYSVGMLSSVSGQSATPATTPGTAPSPEPTSQGWFDSAITSGKNALSALTGSMANAIPPELKDKLSQATEVLKTKAMENLPMASAQFFNNPKYSDWAKKETSGPKPTLYMSSDIVPEPAKVSIPEKKQQVQGTVSIPNIPQPPNAPTPQLPETGVSAATKMVTGMMQGLSSTLASISGSGRSNNQPTNSGPNISDETLMMLQKLVWE